MAYNSCVKNNNTQVDYTVYGAGNQVFLPINTEILIPSDEPVRLLSAIMEELDYSKLMATYSRLGRIEYPPRLLFKVAVYAYSRKIYSTRGIERACRENINFMYLLEGHNPPDHNTIARFRKDHLPNVVEDLLTQLVQLLVAHGVISFEKSAVFIDGTKIEANASRYSFVWKTRVTKSQAKLGEKIAEEIEQDLQNSMEREISTEAIGEKVMERLRAVDQVAYVRFASVYRQFKDIDTFMTELNKLLAEK